MEVGGEEYLRLRGSSSRVRWLGRLVAARQRWVGAGLMAACISCGLRHGDGHVIILYIQFRV